MECLAVIPARGGSKGIPRKNLRLLAGKPLIAHNIEQALCANTISRLVVSTDDAEIAAVSKQYGAEVIWRPAQISGDQASSELALLHVLEQLERTEGYKPDLLTFLQCTSPLTLAEDMDGTLQALLDEAADSAVAVTPFHYFLWQQEPQDAVGINHDKGFRPLRQERVPQFLETGAVYTLRVPGFLAARHRFFGKTALYVMPPERRLEIDDPVDFEIAEVMLRQQHKQRRKRALPDPSAALVLDFDGVFTDNHVVVFQDGREAVVCDRGDGWGLGLIKQAALPVMVLSTEKNPVVSARCEKLKIPYRQGLEDKGGALREWLDETGYDPAGVVYVGNDANDLPCMEQVGCVVVVADAHPSVLGIADLVLQHEGGKGALREICDLILEQLR